MKKPLVLGKYLLLERVNIGGMAEVFIAKTFGVGGFEQILAVKKILPTMAEDEEFIKMFFDEARISVQLNHPNIVHIHDLKGSDETYYIVMEYVSGRDLRSVLERFRRRKEYMPIPMAAYIATKMCEGLDYAHRKQDVHGNDFNIVHRDVSPQNILLSYEGAVKLIDFGIAKTAIRSTKTEVGVIKGKFGYMSPEQAYGWPVDRRSDVFAAAVILYEMLTGEKLFVAESDSSTIDKVRRVEFRPPRQANANIPLALEKIILRALEREVDERYQWANELQEELEPFSFTNEGKFSEKHLSFILKDMFSDEYLRETNKLKHYGGLGAPAALALEELPMYPETAANYRKGNASLKTPSGQKKIPKPVFDPDMTQMVPPDEVLEFGEPSRAEGEYDYHAQPQAYDDSLAPLPAQTFSGESPAPIQLLDNKVPVYTGETMVGGQAVAPDITAERPAAFHTQALAVSITSKLQTPFASDEDTGVGPPPSTANSQYKAWLWLGVVVAGLGGLWAVLFVFIGTSSAQGRLVVMPNPEGIPIEITLKNLADEREHRFVVKNETIPLPKGLYKVEAHSADKNYRVRPGNLSTLEIFKKEDSFMRISLEAVETKPGGIQVAANTGEEKTEPKQTETETTKTETTKTETTKTETTKTEPTGPKKADPQKAEPKSVPKPPVQETFVLQLGGELPSGTQVLLGSRLQGTTPALKKLVLPMKGAHKISFRKSGYEVLTQSINNTAREETVYWDVALVPKPVQQPTPPRPPPGSSKRGKLVVTSVPNGADLWINGKKTAFRTPIGFANPMLLPEGKHTLILKAGGKQSEPIAFEIKAEHSNNPLSLRAIPLE